MNGQTQLALGPKRPKIDIVVDLGSHPLAIFYPLAMLEFQTYMLHFSDIKCIRYFLLAETFLF